MENGWAITVDFGVGSLLRLACLKILMKLRVFFKVCYFFENFTLNARNINPFEWRNGQKQIGEDIDNFDNISC